MKRNFARRYTKTSLAIVSAILFSSTLTSCSSLWSHRENAPLKAVDNNNRTASVPREQYEELARKYQELLNQSKGNLKKEEEVQTAPVVKVGDAKVQEVKTGDEQIKPETPSTSLDPSELVSHIDQAIPDQKPVVEGVDVIGGQPASQATPKAEAAKNNPPIPDSMGVQHVNATDDIDDQIVKLREAQDLVKVNKFENALTILKDLENSKEKQIVVRAKMMLGDLLFGQGEFDLAMQVYEEVVKKYAFSGSVLKALGRLVACSEKLKLPEKQAKYYSLLHDFFEAA